MKANAPLLAPGNALPLSASTDKSDVITNAPIVSNGVLDTENSKKLVGDSGLAMKANALVVAVVKEASLLSGFN